MARHILFICPAKIPDFTCGLGCAKNRKVFMNVQLKKTLKPNLPMHGNVTWVNKCLLPFHPKLLINVPIGVYVYFIRIPCQQAEGLWEPTPHQHHRKVWNKAQRWLKESTHFNMIMRRLTDHNQPNASTLEEKWLFNSIFWKCILIPCSSLTLSVWVSLTALQVAPVVYGDTTTIIYVMATIAVIFHYPDHLSYIQEHPK